MDDFKCLLDALETPVYIFSLPITNLDIEYFSEKFRKLKNNKAPPPKTHCDGRVETTIFFLLLSKEIRGTCKKNLSKIGRPKRKMWLNME